MSTKINYIVPWHVPSHGKVVLSEEKMLPLEWQVAILSSSKWRQQLMKKFEPKDPFKKVEVTVRGNLGLMDRSIRDMN